MQNLLYILWTAVGVAACSPAAKPMPAAPPIPTGATPKDAMSSSSANAACAEPLARLVAGDLSQWTDLPTCTRADVDARLGNGENVSPGEFGWSRKYPATAASPHGAEVFFDANERMTLVGIFLPKLEKSPRAQLGEPEHTLDSGLGAGMVQRVYASRGLVVHIEEHDDTIVHIYGFAKTTVAEFLTSGLAKVRNYKDPVRE